ncbi:MAG: 50S ribosomal protein L25/general stress protein Ctc [Tetrasphaera sp.]
MSSENRILVELRTEFGKGAARRVRRAAKIPAVIYGHGTDPVHITMPGHDTMMVLKNPNALLTLVIDGDEQLALAKDVQRNPVKPVIEHVDLVVVRRGEKVTVDVPVHVDGEAAAETVVTLENPTLQVECEATSIPEHLLVSIEGLEAGTQVLAASITLPEGVTLVSDGELLVVNVAAMISQEALDAELADAEAEAGFEQDEAERAEDRAEPAVAGAAEEPQGNQE